MISWVVLAYLVSPKLTAHVSALCMQFIPTWGKYTRWPDMGKACVDGRSLWINGYVLSLVAGWWQMTIGATLSRSFTELFNNNRPYIEIKHYHSAKTSISISSFVLSYHFYLFKPRRWQCCINLTPFFSGKLNNITVVDPLNLKKNPLKHNYILGIQNAKHMAEVTKVRLSCYLVLLSTDSKTR